MPTPKLSAWDWVAWAGVSKGKGKLLRGRVVRVSGEKAIVETQDGIERIPLVDLIKTKGA
jgi:hypothetical protein